MSLILEDLFNKWLTSVSVNPSNCRRVDGSLSIYTKYGQIDAHITSKFIYVEGILVLEVKKKNHKIPLQKIASINLGTIKSTKSLICIRNDNLLLIRKLFCNNVRDLTKEMDLYLHSFKCWKKIILNNSNPISKNITNISKNGKLSPSASIKYSNFVNL